MGKKATNHLTHPPTSRLMFEWRWWNCTFHLVSSLLVPPSLSFAGRTPVKMLDCFRGEQKSSSKLEVFHFSYKLSWTFQIDPQPSPDHDNMPWFRGQFSVESSLDSGNVVTIWLSVKECGNQKLKLSTSVPETPSSQVSCRRKAAVLQLNAVT